MPRQVPLLRPGADPKPRCPGVDAPLRRDSAGVRRAVQSKMDVVPPSEDNDLVYDFPTKKLLQKTTLFPLPHLLSASTTLQPRIATCSADFASDLDF